MTPSSGTTHRLLTACLALACLLPPVHAQDASIRPGNLDFEDEQRGPLPAGWDGFERGHAITTDCGAAHGGRCALQVEGSDDTNVRTAALYQHIGPVRVPAGRLTLSGWVRLDGLGSLAALVLAVGSAPPKETRIDGVVAGDWQRVQVSVDVPPGADSLDFGLWFGGVGRAWFDDLQISANDRRLTGG